MRAAWLWNSRTRLADRRGFSVIELAVALSILSIGLMGLASMIPLAKSDLTQSNQRTNAVFLAEETVEWLHSMDFSDSLLTAGSYTTQNFTPGFDRTWTVEDNVPITDVKRVTVNITHTGQDSSAARVVFLYARAGR